MPNRRVQSDEQLVSLKITDGDLDGIRLILD